MQNKIQLTARENVFLTKLKKAAVPEWRRSFGFLLLILGSGLLLLHIVAVSTGITTHIFNSGVVDLAVFTLLNGAFQFQTLRYQKIIKYLMNSAKENGVGLTPTHLADSE